MKTERPCPKCGEHDFEIRQHDIQGEEMVCLNCEASFDWAEAWDQNINFILLKRNESIHLHGDKTYIINHKECFLCKVWYFFRYLFK